MSPNKREDAMRRFRWPVSPVNIVLVAVCVIGAVVCFSFGAPRLGIPLLIGGVVGGIGAIVARRGSSGDLERVNSLEYADERDRAAGVKGLAAVGALALIAGAGQLLLFAIVRPGPVASWTAAGVFLALIACWFVANWFFVRRG